MELENGVVDFLKFKTNVIEYNDKCFLCELLRSEKIPEHIPPSQLCITHLVEMMQRRYVTQTSPEIQESLCQSAIQMLPAFIERLKNIMP